MTTPLDIQDSIEKRIETVTTAINRTASNGGAGRPNVVSQYWVAYEGSTGEKPDDVGYGDGFTQRRILTFASYVEVRDLQRDYREAMEIHESLIALINGFFPPLEDVEGPLILTDDGPISVRTDLGPTYRYRGRYQTVLTQWTSPTNPEPFRINKLVVGLFRSPAGQVGEPPPIATKDAELATYTES